MHGNSNVHAFCTSKYFSIVCAYVHVYVRWAGGLVNGPSLIEMALTPKERMLNLTVDHFFFENENENEN